MGLKKNKTLLAKMLLIGTTIIFVSGVALDQWICRKANERILRAEAFFDIKLREANLDFVNIKKAPRKTCKIEHIFSVYAYQTCFVRFSASKDPNNWGYRFIYSKPRPLLAILFRGDSSRDVYFTEAGDGPFGVYLKFVTADKKVIDKGR